MRLINTTTLELEEFASGTDVQYAILSHRWEHGEVTFQNMQSSARFHKEGYVHKVRPFCQLAASNNLPYGWIDTCCIDKASSAELSEAINSMYRWYENAAVCYAYLSDVERLEYHFDNSPKLEESAWFTRGWTLQELLAPKSVIFFNRSWRKLGDRSSLVFSIATTTGIPVEVLDGQKSIFSYNIAQRMSWAARRKTTRVEDMAYCLMGLFDVNMPMLYGEGDKAFLRLQEEIIKHSDDKSIFAWTGVSETRSGLLAPSPAAFADSNSIEASVFQEQHLPYNMTNRGLSITLSLTPWSRDVYLARINCEKHNGSVGIFLQKLAEQDQYTRVRLNDGAGSTDLPHIHRKLVTDRVWRMVLVYVRQQGKSTFSPNDKHGLCQISGFRLSQIYSPRHDSGLLPLKYADFVYDFPQWEVDHKRGLIEMPVFPYGTEGNLNISRAGRRIRFIRLGFDFDFNPVCILSVSPEFPLRNPPSPSSSRLDLTKSLTLFQPQPQHQLQSINVGSLLLTSSSSSATAISRSGSPLSAESCFCQENTKWIVADKRGTVDPDQMTEFLGKQNATYAFKGDRVKGLYAVLRDRERTWVSLERGKTDHNTEVWLFSIGDSR